MRVWVYALFCVLSQGLDASTLQNTSFGKLKFTELSDNSIKSVAQFKQVVKDEKGIFWFATLDGLYSYDGYHFTSYRKDYTRKNGSLVDDSIYSLASKGERLFIGSSSAFHEMSNGKISPYVSNDKTLLNYIGDELEYSVNDDLPEESARTLQKLNNGNIWIGLETVIAKYKESEKEFEVFPVTENITYLTGESSSDSLEITGLVTFNEKQFWLATVSHGLIYYDSQLNKASQLIDASISRIKSLDASTLLLATTKGLLVYDVTQRRIVSDHPLSSVNGPINGLFVTGKGEVWVGSNSVYHFVDGNITIYDPKLDFKIDSLDPKVGEIFVDELNTVLVCFDNVGVFRASPLTSTARLINDVKGTSNNVTVTKSSTRHGTLVGYTKGLIKSDITKNRISYNVLEKSKGEGFGNVTDIHFGISDQVWIAERNQIILYKENGSTIYPIGEEYTKDKYVYKLVQDFSGVVWFTVLRNGIFKLDPDTGLITREKGLEDLRLHRWLSIDPLLMDERRKITFVKSKRGFVEFDLIKSEIIKEYKDQALEKEYHRRLPFRESAAWFVHQSLDERFWVTHAEAYISTFDPISGNGETINTPIKKSIVGLHIEGDKYWLLEENGNVFIWDTLSNRVEVIGKEQGIPKSGVSAWSISSLKGTVAIGARDGLVLVPVSNLGVSSEAPSTTISSIEVNHNSSDLLDSQSKFELLHNENVITFRFFTTGTSAPDSARYRYRLKGAYEEWHETNSEQRVAHYTSLPAGDYSFDVQSKEANSQWGESESVMFNIKPAIWNTLLAKILYMLLFFLVIYFGYRIRITAIEKKNLLLEEQVQNKTTELTHLLDFKNHFVLDLTHELKTMLHVQSGEYESLFDFLEDNPGFDTRLLKRSSKRMNRLIDQLLALAAMQGGNSLSLSTVNLSSLVTRTLPFFDNMAKSFDVELQKEIVGENLYVQVDTETVERVITNLVGNAIKYNRKNGAVKVKVFKEQDNVVLMVSDTGVGIPSKMIPQGIEVEMAGEALPKRSARLIGHGVGLSLTAKAVELNGGTLKLSTEQGQGTIFRVVFPSSNLANKSLDVMNESNVKMINLEVEAAVSDEEVVCQIEHKLESKDERPLVLLIDDNIDVLSGLAPKLNKYFNIALSLSGESGLDKALALCPDLILTDLNMPGMSGFDLLKQVKSSPIIGHIPVLILTAMTDKNIHITGIDLGADDTICKPIETGELIKRVSNRLEANRALYERFKKENIVSSVELQEDVLTDNSTYALERKNANEWLEKLNAYIEANVLNKDSLKVGEVARHMQCPQSVVTSKLKTIAGIHGIKAYIRDYRLQLAHEKLKDGVAGKLQFFAQEFGFAGDEFSRFYKIKYGFPPSKTKKESL